MAENDGESPIIQIGTWKLDTSSGELKGSQGTIRLEPKSLDVLVTLAKEPGRVFTKQALIEKLWPDTYVTEHVLWRCISQLRKSLGDDLKRPLYIETLPKKGYRLVAQVRELPRKSPLPTHPSRRLGFRVVVLFALVSLTCISVLVHLFQQHESGTPSDSPRVSALAAKEREAREQYQMGLASYWSERADGNDTAIVHLQRALKLLPSLAEARAALSDAYLQRFKSSHESGAERWAELALKEARSAYGQKPEKAEVLKALGRAYKNHGRFEEAAEAYRAALEIDPGYLLAMNNLAVLKVRTGEVDEAICIQTRMLRLSPDSQFERFMMSNLAGMHLRLDDLDQALEVARNSMQRFPESCQSQALLAAVEFIGGRIGEARRVAQKGLERNPDDLEMLKVGAMIEQARGQSEAALQLLDRKADEDRMDQAFGYHLRRASLLMSEGRSVEAEQVLGRVSESLGSPPRPGRPFRYSESDYYIWRSMISCIRGDVDSALESLQRATELGHPVSTWLTAEPIFDSLKDHEEFASIISRLRSRSVRLRERVTELLGSESCELDASSTARSLVSPRPPS